jgi:L-alanine-DL-glutamate epimerase-like enolase superfamily enzyme
MAAASWTPTTIIVVDVEGGGQRGWGFTYSDAVVADFINSKLAAVVSGCIAMDPPSAWRAMRKAVRDLGREGLVATAISAVGIALWDLEGRIVGSSAGKPARPLSRQRCNLRQRWFYER